MHEEHESTVPIQETPTSVQIWRIAKWHIDSPFLRLSSFTHFPSSGFFQFIRNVHAREDYFIGLFGYF